MKTRSLLLSLLLLSLSTAVTAVSPQYEKAIDLHEPEAVEKYSTAKWKKLADKARNDFFRTFNKFNEDSKYDVICEIRSTLGTQIKKRHCEPRYFKQRMYEFTQQQGVTQGTSPNLQFFPNQENVLWLTRNMEEGADENLVELMSQHPELKDKFVEYVRAAEAYNYKRSLN
jgi:hypothetical protein